MKIFERPLPSIIDTYTVQNQIGFSERNLISADLGLHLTQLKTWNDWQAVQKFSWGWHWSTFKSIGC